MKWVYGRRAGLVDDLADNVKSDVKNRQNRYNVQKIDGMEGNAKEDIGGLDEEVVKITLPNKAPDAVYPSEEKLGQNIDDVESQKEKRCFRQRVSGQGIRVLENGVKKEEKKAHPDELP